MNRETEERAPRGPNPGLALGLILISLTSLRNKSMCIVAPLEQDTDICSPFHYSLMAGSPPLICLIFHFIFSLLPSSPGSRLSLLLWLPCESQGQVPPESHQTATRRWQRRQMPDSNGRTAPKHEDELGTIQMVTTMNDIEQTVTSKQQQPYSSKK